MNEHLNHYLKTNPTINPKLLYKQLGEEPGSAKICLTFSRRLVPEFRSLCPQIVFFPYFVFFFHFTASYDTSVQISDDTQCVPCELRGEQPACSFFIFLHSDSRCLKVVAAHRILVAHKSH